MRGSRNRGRTEARRRRGRAARARGPGIAATRRPLIAAALGVALASALVTACAPAWTGPAATVELLSVRAYSGESGSGFTIAYRVEAGASGERLTRYGLAARGRSDRGEYRAGELREVGLPPGACLYGEIRIEFDDPAERYVEGSAAIEGFWAE